MQVAKVIGNIWATRKDQRLAGLKLLLVQPINPLTGGLDRVPMVAADIIGAGVGETVLVVGGSSARRTPLYARHAAATAKGPGPRCSSLGAARQKTGFIRIDKIITKIWMENFRMQN